MEELEARLRLGEGKRAPRVRAVFFDLGGTLLRVEPSVGEIYALAAARHGCDVQPEAIEKNLRTAWQRSLERGRTRGFLCSDAILKQEWFEIVCETFGPLLPARLAPAVFEDLYAHFATGAAWVLASGAQESLSYLRRRGIKLGVLSNWDSRFRVMMRDLRLEREFDILIVSHEVGYEKPHPEIFRAALRLAGTSPEETLHVGDSLDADIVPARELGFHTLWVASRTQSAQKPEAGASADSLAQVSGALWDRLVG